MSTVYNVDAFGKRILDDILVSGFTHEVDQRYNLTIPDEIISIIFMFWLINVCDEWDQSLTDGAIHFDGQCAKWMKEQRNSIFGKKSVESGTFEWRFRFKRKISWCCIGLIEDESEILKSNQRNNWYFLDKKGLCLFSTGSFYTRGHILADGGKNYCDDLTKMKMGVTVYMVLDANERTITFHINDKQYATLPIGVSIKKYKLIITMSHKDDEIELL